MEKTRPNNLRIAANLITGLRALSTVFVSREILKSKDSFRSWKLGLAVGAIAVSDIADGYLARRSNQPSAISASFDELTDKALYHGTINAIGVRAKQPKYHLYSAITLARDVVLTHERGELRRQGLNAEARLLGKVKTWGQMIALAFDASPIGESYPRTTQALHIGAVALAVGSGLEFMANAHKAQLSQKEIVQVPCETKII